MFQWL